MYILEKASSTSQDQDVLFASVLKTLLKELMDAMELNGLTDTKLLRACLRPGSKELGLAEVSCLTVTEVSVDH